jgi:hypothetical protein
MGCVCMCVYLRAVTSYLYRLSPIQSNELGMFSPNIIVTFDSDWRIQNSNESKTNRKHPQAPTFLSKVTPTHLVLRPLPALPKSDDRSLGVQYCSFSQKIPLAWYTGLMTKACCAAFVLFDRPDTTYTGLSLCKIAPHGTVLWRGCEMISICNFAATKVNRSCPVLALFQSVIIGSVGSLCNASVIQCLFVSHSG